MIDFRNDIKDLIPYVPGKPIDDVKREYGLSHVVKLASNENAYGCSENAKKAVVDCMRGASLYPDGNCTLLREAIAKKHDINSNRIVFGCGTDEIISMIGKIYINPGDECVTGAVTFSQYAASVLSMGGKMVYSPMKNHGFDLNDILAKITGRTKVIFIANPNNPTGTVHSAKEQKEFMEKVPSNILVAFDEAYSEFVEDMNYPDTFSMLDKYKNIIYMKTFSKAYGLASLRVGFAIADESIITLFEKIRNPFNVSVPAQVAAVAAFEDTEFLNESIRKNKMVRAIVSAEFDKMGLQYIPSQSNFIMVDIKKNSMDMFIKLIQKSYIVRPGAAFGMDTYIRVTLGTPEEMQGFISALKLLL